MKVYDINEICIIKCVIKDNEYLYNNVYNNI